MANDNNTQSGTDTTADAQTAGQQGGLGGVLSGKGPMVDQVKDFAKRRPFAFAAVAGVLGVALLNTLRGKGRERG